MLALSQEERDERRRELREAEKREARESGTVSSLIDREAPENTGDEHRDD